MNKFYEMGSEWELDQRKYLEYMKKHSLVADRVGFNAELYVESLSDEALKHVKQWGTSVAVWNRRTRHAVARALGMAMTKRFPVKPVTGHGMAEDQKQKTTPKVETPKVETPKVETPKVETPKVEKPIL